MNLRSLGILAATIFLTSVAVQAQDTVATSDLWYAPVLRSHFPSQIAIHGIDYSISEIPCLPKDITKFRISPGAASAFGVQAFQVSGSINLGAIPEPFEVFDGAQGPRYMLHLQAYLFSPQGELVWSQQGFPAGGAWKDASGDSASFILVAAYEGSTSGFELLVLAAGDPILSDSSETRVILGAARINVP